MRLANETNDEKMVNDFNHTYYELEAKRKNFGNALHFLQLVYKQDSVNFRKNETAKIDLIVDQSHKNELIRKNELYRVKQEKKNIILNVGRLVEQKNQLELIEIFSVLPLKAPSAVNSR